MLHGENTVRLLEYQDEIRIEPYSKRMKSTEEACGELPVDNKCTQKKVDVERKSNDCIPMCALDNEGQREMEKQEKIPTGVLGSLNEVLSENNPVLSQPVDLETVQNINPTFESVNYSKVEEEKDPFSTNNAGEDSVEKSSTSFLVNRNESDEDFFTSKDFIGPIYKPTKSNKKDKSANCNECRNTGGDENELYENRCKRKEAKKMQAVSATVPEIDDELDQFYKEIHQLENENLDTNVQEKETEISQEQHSPFNSSQSSQENYQPVLLGSPQPHYENGQCSLGEQNSQNTNNEQQLVVETGVWKTGNTCNNGQVDSWNSSVPEFRPAWQIRASFTKSQGPFPPRFNHQSHFQIFNPPPRIPNVPPSQNEGLPYESYRHYHGNTDINSHGPLLDQNTNYSCHTDIHTTQVFRNGNNDQNGLQSNGFCETREECWNDPKADSTEGVHSFSSLQLSEERFSSQKLLLLLRGLPGSGKTTLSRVLLGQSHDGIVLSTDDYFRQQYGYSYNAAQLGDAHEWNRKRAKQAMEQGKSPVIIDNTNTQAWEMKPYVEVALEKGYRVEFHEPDTWWKFDPEELEKRNKHGVTREKIAQMLERYEYQISIPIVMNSVVPPHKNTQRPPLQRRHRETRTYLSKNPGYLLTKAKQKKKRKRNKTVKSNFTEITKKMLCGVAHHPIPGDHDGSESEEDDLEEENKKSLSTFSKSPEDPITVYEEQPKSGDERLKEAAGFPGESSLVTVPEVSVMSNSAWKNELPVESDGLLLKDVKPFCIENLTKNGLDEEAKLRHKDNLCSFLTITNDKNSTQETEGISEDCHMSLLSTENKLGSCQITCEPDLEAKLVSLKSEEKEISQCYNSIVLDDMSDNTEGKCPLKPEETSSNAWAFFSSNLSTEELQMGFNTQVSLSPCSEDKFVSEQRAQKVRKQTHTNSSAELNCYQSREGLVSENHHETETEEADNVISNGLSVSPTGKGHFDSLVEARATFMQGSGEVNVPIDATPIMLKRKRYRRIVNLAPKFNLPRQIFGHAEGQKDVCIREDIPQNSVLEVRQNHLVSENCGEAHEQDHALQEYSLPTLEADALLYNISYIHSGQCSPISKYASRVCVDSKTKEVQATTLQPQQVVNKKEDEGEHTSSEVTNGQPDILSSVKVVSEYLEDSNTLASCSENANGADDSEPAKASQLEDYQDADMKYSFLGLPLSLGFAFQLVQLFGSPGLPLESLLPDDYIVPLDWKVSKMIYLLWKTSVEEKQKTNGLQNGDGLTDDIISLEDLNKNHQENQDSSETLSDMELCQDVIEENIITCTGCLDAAFHQS
ncbi:PREDICTED: NEDD4-binding protein 2-like 2 isoform X1 [Pseudopodoces humilis]|uniref:NEDD4-binding protein 2-like 2 isoform X1 n=1 Tax=Pseudopodoces humilis TaxID=181119 RepID=UPI0006B7ED0B|nr:PREDICTED: NEDD4-binding protein 2-like 2 isoform X1 [Pseudopodoces humilis]XP_014107126.1 PREDICTED: NEDD4-binding protein 2-like 2 isoform X1 [Pseudopodoces humilis]XP_014107131.1 PREDICTED: NEDD4-binding protein 2-like 2 isoform X1 [Pseudopodoces humilis]